MIKSLLTEYGLKWFVNRSLYSSKLNLMKAIPNSDKIFEKNSKIKRINLIDLNVKSIESFLESLSMEQKNEIIFVANNAIEGKILGFSSIELNYGNPINWHYNPITNIEVDRFSKWYSIPDFDPERGDIKIIWEASRFTHFFYLVRAYMLTKDIKYYYAFSNQLSGWLEDNPYSYGVNYKCGQEATLRVINALFTYAAFKAYGLVTEKDTENLFQLVEGSYKKVLSNFFYAHKCIKNNHALTEIVGLIIGAWCCEDENSLKKAYSLLDKEIEYQFHSDGGYIQHSFNYQRFALQLIELVMKVSQKTNIEISRNSKERIKNSAYLMFQLQDLSGDMSNYGPNDGALIFPVTASGYRDFRPVINAIYYLIDGHRIYEEGIFDEELLWFGTENLDDIPVSLIGKQSVSFNESGFYSLQHGSGFLMTVLQNHGTRPSHMDQLHLDVWHQGINIFCDSGTYSYATEIGKQMSFTSAHNTVVVNGAEQMKKYGPFLVYDWTDFKNVDYVKDKYFKGAFISKNGYAQTRIIERTKSGYLITDEVLGEGGYCEFNFHTPCEVKVTSTGFSLYVNNDCVCNVITNGNVELKKVYRSLYYLKLEEITRVSVKANLINGLCKKKFKIELLN